MTRLLPAALFAAFAVGVATLPTNSAAEDPKAKQKEKAKQPKEKPKKPARIAINEPKELADNKDFAIQGEYEGTISLNSGEKKVGAQVISKGEGKFAVKVLMGGLPGAGADPKAEPLMAEAKRGDGDSAEITGKTLSGTIGGGKLTLKDGMKIDTTLTKVERKSPTIGAKPPEGAVVLFGKEGDEANWNGGKLVKLSDGTFLGVGTKSKQAFGDFKAHCEFRLPWMPNSGGQGRGNSGFYLQDRYEVQMLDSFGLKGENNECGGVYTLAKPSVNMCLPPMTWQTYDIEFTAAKFDGDKKVKPAILTLVHNGVKIHDKVELKGSTGGGQKESAKPGPIQLQNHGDPLVFRNVWVVETK